MQTNIRTLNTTAEILAERSRQDAKFGADREQPDGTGDGRATVYVEAMQKIVGRSMEDGSISWAAILLEEVSEALAEKPGSPNLRTELVQIAAVCVAWVENIDRRAESAPAA